MTNLEKARLELEQAKKEKLQTEHQITRLENRLKTALRKQNTARTHRLVVEGAELEYVFENIEMLSKEKFWEFMGRLSSLPEVTNLYKEYRNLINTSDSETKEGGDA